MNWIFVVLLLVLICSAVYLFTRPDIYPKYTRFGGKFLQIGVG